jgi:drug/metabolite transporter (DMT)-like permease
MSRTTRGYLIALTGTAIWSSTAVFIRYLTTVHAMPPLLLAFWRDLMVSAALAIVLAVVAPGVLHIERRHWRFLLLHGFILSLFNGLWTVAVALDGAAVATVLTYSSPAFTALLAWRIFGERLNAAKLVAVGLSIVGCIFVAGAYDPATWRINALGIVVGALSGVGFAAYSIMGKFAAIRRMDPWATVLYTFFAASMFLLLYHVALGWLPGAAPSAGLFYLGASLPGWAALIGLAIGPTVAGYGLYNVTLNYLPASVANLIATLEPSMTAVLAFLFLGERFTTAQIWGALLVMGGVVVLRLGDRWIANTERQVAPS